MAEPKVDTAQLTEAIDAYVRRVVRQELYRCGLIPAGRLLADDAKVTGELLTTSGAPTEQPDVCGARDPQRPQRVCLKPPHKGRHKYELQAAPAPERKWEKVSMAEVKQGSRTYIITDKHHPVKVQGFGRAGAAGDGWQVIGLERHVETGEINVEVIKSGKNQRSRVVKLDRIVYKRPKKGVST